MRWYMIFIDFDAYRICKDINTYPGIFGLKWFCTQMSSAQTGHGTNQTLLADICSWNTNCRSNQSSVNFIKQHPICRLASCGDQLSPVWFWVTVIFSLTSVPLSLFLWRYHSIHEYQNKKKTSRQVWEAQRKDVQISWDRIIRINRMLQNNRERTDEWFSSTAPSETSGTPVRVLDNRYNMGGWWYL